MMSDKPKFIIHHLSLITQKSVLLRARAFAAGPEAAAPHHHKSVGRIVGGLQLLQLFFELFDLFGHHFFGDVQFLDFVQVVLGEVALVAIGTDAGELE